MLNISIITINYNNKSGLKKTFESIFSQTFPGFEFIVIDGGSNDGSKELIEMYNDRINYWVSEPDSGIYNAMNKGIRYGKGEYLIFINSGDGFYDDFVLENTVAAIEKCPGKDIYYGNTCVSGGAKNEGWEKNEPTVLSMDYFMVNTICHQAAFIKRSLFEKVGMYSEKLQICSDWKFFMDVIFKHNCSYKKINLMIARFNEDGISSDANNLKRINEERRQVLIEDSGNYLYDHYFYSRDVLVYIKHSRLIRLFKKIGFLKGLRVD